MQSFVVNQTSSFVKSNEEETDQYQLQNEFTLSNDQKEPQRTTINAWNTKSKVKLRQHMAMKSKYKNVRALVKSSAKPLHHRISSLKPNSIPTQHQSESMDDKQLSHKMLPPGK